MSSAETATVSIDSLETKKRKRDKNEEDLEIDLDAPEPPSKKALRKARKTKSTKHVEAEITDEIKGSEVIGAEDVVPNRGKRSDYGIWIGNLSFTTTKQDLLNFISGDSEFSIAPEKVTRINLPAGPVKFGKFQNKGFAYIDLADSTALQSAQQLSEKLLGGRRVLIKSANSFEGRPKEGAKENSGHPPSKRIFIGNLDFDTTVEDLERHFGVCGPIQHTQMATFEDSGKCKGYAWVEFEQLSAGQAAMRGWVESNEQKIGESVNRSKKRVWLSKMNGRKLRMEFAEDKTTRYNKRFGKNAQVGQSAEDTPAIQEVPVVGENSQRPQRHHRERNSSISDSAHHMKTGHKPRRQRYTDETVKKLTGAIVEGQGQKVTFD